MSDDDLTEASRSARLAAVWALHHRTNRRQSWIAEKPGLRAGANVIEQVSWIDSEIPPEWTKSGAWKQWAKIAKELLNDAKLPIHKAQSRGRSAKSHSRF